MKSHFLKFLAPVLFTFTFSIGDVFARGDEQTKINSSLEGTWLLDSVEIKQITPDGDTVLLPYNPDAFANSTDCIYPILKIQNNQCSFEYKNIIDVVDYAIKENNHFLFWFTAPVEFEYMIQQENKLLISRRYNYYSEADKYSADVLIRLTYLKQ
jgi:hypothetical protein